MLGFNFINVGEETPSSKYAFTKSIFPLNSIITLSILVACSNSNIITLEFSLEILFIFFIPLVVAKVFSKGLVTPVSTFSGLAPGYVVITITYGKFKLGNKSVVIFVNEIPPNNNIIITATTTVNGFFTLNFDNKFFPPKIT